MVLLSGWAYYPGEFYVRCYLIKCSWEKLGLLSGWAYYPMSTVYYIVSIFLTHPVKRTLAIENFPTFQEPGNKTAFTFFPQRNFQHFNMTTFKRISAKVLLLTDEKDGSIIRKERLCLRRGGLIGAGCFGLVFKCNVKSLQGEP